MMISDEFAKQLIELDEETLKAQLAIQEQEIANGATSRSASSLESYTHFILFLHQETLQYHFPVPS